MPVAGTIVPSAGRDSVRGDNIDWARRAPVGAETKTVTDSSFHSEVLGSEKPVLVDFWAEWCGPCKMVAPVLEEIARDHADKITVAKLNIDENPEVARQYQIMSIPTMSVFSGGRIVKSIVGAKPKGALLRDLAEYI
jgi:thioredoxin 1